MMPRDTRASPDELFTASPPSTPRRPAERTGLRRDYSYWRSTFRTFLKSPVSVFLLTLIVVLDCLSPSSIPCCSPSGAQRRSTTSTRHAAGTCRPDRELVVRHRRPRAGHLGPDLVRHPDLAAPRLRDRRPRRGHRHGRRRRSGATSGKLDRVMTELYNVLNNIPPDGLPDAPGLHHAAGLLDHRASPCAPRAGSAWPASCATRSSPSGTREYNVASRCLGTPLRRIITKNVLPYLVSVLIMRRRP
ncbi:MAG: hypothetical protein MZV65_15915 [Chromatiales bacterium]|nr:hypothetical protein [Chromatiales bacterium]